MEVADRDALALSVIRTEMSVAPAATTIPEGLVPRCLLVSSDNNAVTALLPLFEGNGIAVEVCADVEFARQLLTARRFDGAALDCDTDPEPTLTAIGDLRRSPATRTLVLLAMADATRLNAGLSAGANFAIEKPILPDLAGKTIRTSCRLMMAERRRYFRLAVEIPVALEIQGERFEVTAVNLSEGGMGIVTTHPLERGERCTARFTLPISQEQLTLNGEVAWTDTNARAGIRFLGVADSARYTLDHWLARAARNEVVPADPSRAVPQTAPEGPRRERPQPQSGGLGGRVLTALLALFILFVLAFWLALAGIGSIAGNFAALTLLTAVAAAGVMLKPRNHA